MGQGITICYLITALGGVGNWIYFYIRSDSCPEWMLRYFDAEGKFDFHLFMSDLLKGIDTAVQYLFREKTYIKNTGQLSRVTPNTKYSHKKCYNCTFENSTLKESQLFKQCKFCILSTCQTKMGACVQLRWSKFRRDLFNFETCYVSIDLVPAMFIQQLMTQELQRFTNSHMLSWGHPVCWFDHLKNFVKEDKILEGTTDFSEIDRVLLKTYSCTTHNGYFIRAGPLLGFLKFQTDRLRKAYCYIKAIKKILGIDNVSMYMVKKLLMQDKFLEMDSANITIQELVRKILLTPELRTNKFDKKIDFQKWSHNSSYIPIKNQNSAESLCNMILYDYCVPLMGPDLFNGDCKQRRVFLLVLSSASILFSLGGVATIAIHLACSLLEEASCIINDNIVIGLHWSLWVVSTACLFLLVLLLLMSQDGKFRSISLLLILLVTSVIAGAVLGVNVGCRTTDHCNIPVANDTILFVLIFVFVLVLLIFKLNGGKICSISFFFYMLVFTFVGIGVVLFLNFADDTTWTLGTYIISSLPCALSLLYSPFVFIVTLRSLVSKRNTNVEL